jgi:hypothetical protein
MELRLIRDQLNKCYKTESVNHYQNCKELAEKYLNLLKESKVKGWKSLNDTKTS